MKPVTATGQVGRKGRWEQLMTTTTSQSRFRRFFHAQLQAWRDLLGPAKPLVELLHGPPERANPSPAKPLHGPPERAHPSQLCRCFSAGNQLVAQLGHQPDCAWMAVRCRACSGIGRCRSCDGYGFDPAAYELPVSPSGVVDQGAGGPWGALEETKISDDTARLAGAEPASVRSEPRVDLSDAGARR